MAEPVVVDGAAAVSGSAVFVADRSPKGLLFGRARIGAAAVSGVERAARVDGVRSVRVIPGAPGAALVVATADGAARDGLAALAIEPGAAAPAAEPEPAEQVGEPDAELKRSPARTKALYTLPLSAPGCLEPEAWLVRFGEDLEVFGSAVPESLASGLAAALGVPAQRVRAAPSVPPGCPRPDRTALLAECARLSRELDAPVRLTVEELAPAAEPLAVEIDLGANDEGGLTAWSSVSRGASGLRLPWGFDVTHRLHRCEGGTAQAGDAEASYFTSVALDDAAAALGIGPYQLTLANLPTAGNREALLRRLLAAADERMVLGRRWHPRGDAGKGDLRRGLGLGVGGAGRGLLAVMADAAVDWETGRVEVRRLVAAATAEPALDASAVRALVIEGLVRGVTCALTAGGLAAARMGDAGEIEVELLEAASGGVLPDSKVGELVTAAAIGNAVANAIGVRVGRLPLTPQAVLQALARW